LALLSFFKFTRVLAQKPDSEFFMFNLKPELPPFGIDFKF